MKWLLNRFGAQTTKIWPFEAAGALETTAGNRYLTNYGQFAQL